jgi:MGT family glycosyltransferase
VVPEGVILESYLPQIAMLERAALCLTHAGLNTTIEALNAGVPLVAVPITNDQPAVGARIARSGAGKVLGLKSLTVEGLVAAIREVLREPNYRARAEDLGKEIARAGGVSRAADIIETTIRARSAGDVA